MIPMTVIVMATPARTAAPIMSIIVEPFVDEGFPDGSPFFCEVAASHEVSADDNESGELLSGRSSRAGSVNVRQARVVGGCVELVCALGFDGVEGGVDCVEG